MRPLRWDGPVWGYSGYAEEARYLAVALSRAGWPVAIKNIGTEGDSGEIAPPLRRKLERLARAPMPEKFVQVIHFYGTSFALDPAAGCHVWRTMFEATGLPHGWRERANSMHAVWVPSQFNQQSFVEAGVHEDKVRVLPQFVDTDLFRPAPVEPWTGTFTFLSVFRWHMRKGWDILLAAFVEEFSKDDGVQLVLRTDPDSSDGAHGAVRRAIDGIRENSRRRSRREPPRIVLESARRPGSAMPDLYRSADCFVLPSRGEGWGRPYMEAMATGLPVIATRWGGNLDFMDDSVAYLIDAKAVGVERRIIKRMPWFTPLMQWAQPDKEHLRALMRHVYENRAEARAVGAAARRRIIHRFSAERIAQIARDNLGLLDEYRR